MRPTPKPPMTPYKTISIGTLTEKIDKENAIQVTILPGFFVKIKIMRFLVFSLEPAL